MLGERGRKKKRKRKEREKKKMLKRRKGVTPGQRHRVRGEAMNPVDHPHGGRTRGGRQEVTPWGKRAEGLKQRKERRWYEKHRKKRKGTEKEKEEKRRKRVKDREEKRRKYKEKKEKRSRRKSM